MRAMKMLCSLLLPWTVTACYVAPAAADAREWDQTYEAAVTASAIRRPSWEIRLRSLPDADVVTAGSFTQYEWLDTLHYDVWVSSPEELREKCRGRRDATLAIQQVLGLPPRKPRPGNQWRIVLVEVPTRSLFRPCPGDPRLQAAVCPLASTLGPMDDTAARFLLGQLWASRHASTQSDYGLPFTGMGWTYDWDPSSANHVGVSEFVVRRGTPTQNARSVTPGGVLQRKSARAVMAGGCRADGPCQRLPASGLQRISYSLSRVPAGSYVAPCHALRSSRREER